MHADRGRRDGARSRQGVHEGHPRGSRVKVFWQERWVPPARHPAARVGVRVHQPGGAAEGARRLRLQLGAAHRVRRQEQRLRRQGGRDGRDGRGECGRGGDERGRRGPARGCRQLREGRQVRVDEHGEGDQKPEPQQPHGHVFADGRAVDDVRVGARLPLPDRCAAAREQAAHPAVQPPAPERAQKLLAHADQQPDLHRAQRPARVDPSALHVQPTDRDAARADARPKLCEPARHRAPGWVDGGSLALPEAPRSPDRAARAAHVHRPRRVRARRIDQGVRGE